MGTEREGEMEVEFIVGIIGAVVILLWYI